MNLGFISKSVVQVVTFVLAVNGTELTDAQAGAIIGAIEGLWMLCEAFAPKLHGKS